MSLLSVFSQLSLLLVYAAASVTSTVEHLHSPAGIATLRPRFSWDVSANNRRNLTQLAYSLIIDATADVRGGRAR